MNLETWKKNFWLFEWILVCYEVELNVCTFLPAQKLVQTKVERKRIERIFNWIYILWVLLKIINKKITIGNWKLKMNWFGVFVRLKKKFCKEKSLRKSKMKKFQNEISHTF